MIWLRMLAVRRRVGRACSADGRLGGDGRAAGLAGARRRPRSRRPRRRAPRGRPAGDASAPPLADRQDQRRRADVADGVDQDRDRRGQQRHDPAAERLAQDLGRRTG